MNINKQIKTDARQTRQQLTSKGVMQKKGAKNSGYITETPQNLKKKRNPAKEIMYKRDDFGLQKGDCVAYPQ